MTNQERLDWINRNGGFAFPGTLAMPEGGIFESAGMTLRDWFAGQALVGMNASPALLEAVTGPDAGAGRHNDRLARSAYRQADAMLAERAKADAQS